MTDPQRPKAPGHTVKWALVLYDLCILSIVGGMLLGLYIGVEHLTARGIQIEDMGCYDEKSVHYPAYAEKLGRAVAAGTCEKGILVCGTGIGMSMAANKIPGIRAALCHDCYCVEMTRKHNDANVLCLGGRVLGSELAKKMVYIYLDAEFSAGENHVRRLNMLKELEK